MCCVCWGWGTPSKASEVGHLGKGGWGTTRVRGTMLGGGGSKRHHAGRGRGAGVGLVGCSLSSLGLRGQA